MRGLRLYHRSGCHLCEDMLSDLQRYQGERPFSLELIDIDAHTDLLQRYSDRVPVLESGSGRLLCEAFLDPVALLSYLDGG